MTSVRSSCSFEGSLEVIFSRFEPLSLFPSVKKEPSDGPYFYVGRKRGLFENGTR